MINKMLESVDTVHTKKIYNSKKNNKKDKNNCLYKRYL